MFMILIHITDIMDIFSPSLQQGENFEQYLVRVAQKIEEFCSDYSSYQQVRNLNWILEHRGISIYELLTNVLTAHHFYRPEEFDIELETYKKPKPKPPKQRQFDIEIDE